MDSFPSPQLRSRGVAASLCLNRDEPSGPGNLALIQLLLQAKLLIPSSARVRSGWPQSPGDNGSLEHKMCSKICLNPLKRQRTMGNRDGDSSCGMGHWEAQVGCGSGPVENVTAHSGGLELDGHEGTFSNHSTDGVQKVGFGFLVGHREMIQTLFCNSTTAKQLRTQLRAVP